MEIIKSTIKPTLILGAILMLVFVWFDFRWSISIALGMVVSLLHLIRLDIKVSQGLRERHGKLRWFGMFFSNTMLLASPMILAVAFPQVLNLYAVAIGLLLNKAILYGREIVKKGEGVVE